MCSAGEFAVGLCRHRIDAAYAAGNVDLRGADGTSVAFDGGQGIGVFEVARAVEVGDLPVEADPVVAGGQVARLARRSAGAGLGAADTDGGVAGGDGDLPGLCEEVHRQAGVGGQTGRRPSRPGRADPS